MKIKYFSLIPVAGVLFSSALLLSGCSSVSGPDSVFRAGNTEYLQAESIQTISLPDSLQALPFESVYPIPEVNATDEFGDPVVMTNFELPRPKNLLIEREKFGVKIQEVDGQRWIALSASTGQVWPRVQAFLSQAKFDVVKSDVERGLIETQWLTSSDSDTFAQKYRIYIEQGIHPETSEIHVIQIQTPKHKLVKNPVWPKRSDNKESEVLLADSLAHELAQTIDNKAASLQGLAVGRALKAEFLKSANEPTMRLHLPKLRALGTLSHALTQEHFIIRDESTEQGLFWVDYAPKQDRSFKFWPGGSDDADDSAYTLSEVLAHLDNTQEVKSLFSSVENVQFGEALPEALQEAKGYLVFAAAKPAGYVDVVLRDVRGRLIPREQAKQMLLLIRKNLL